MGLIKKWIAAPHYAALIILSSLTHGRVAHARISEGSASKSVGHVESDNGKDGNPQGVWRRRFDPPLRELPITIIPVGDLFAVWTPSRGILRNPVDLPLYLTTECEVVTRIEPSLFGFTMVYVVTNRTGRTLDLPTLQMPGNALGKKIDHLDHRLGSIWEEIDASDGLFRSTRKELYPQSLYAPSIIMRDSRFAVGLTLQYDMMTYKHQIRTNVYRGASGSSYGEDWAARFILVGTLDPGQSRTYRLHVWYNEPDDWIHTLRPYRDYLRATFGDVQYAQDMRPVWLQQLGDTLRLSEDNRRGFNGYRADLNGFERDVTSIINWCGPAGYQRVMVRTPAGVYYENRQNNFPPQITTEWTQPMAATSDQWRRPGLYGIDLYFWWGRSAQVADRWDDDVLDPFDPNNSEQYQRMMREWDNAIAVGAKGLGFDKFTPLMPWDAGGWLSKLWSHKPDAFFVAEPAAYDILHLRVPTCLYSADVPNPHYVADYLAPGRELWVILGEGEGNLERALELISWGHTIMTTSRTFTARDLTNAIRRAQGEDVTPPP